MKNQSLPRVALAQLNFSVGDIAGNTRKVIEYIGLARDKLGADAVLFPELALTGYPPEDLLLRASFADGVQTALAEVRAASMGLVVLVGYPEYTSEGCYNAVAVLSEGQMIGNYRKQCLPNYQVFDERRYFVPGKDACVFQLGQHRCAVTICEDIWQEGPARQAAQAGARVLLNVNASPFHVDKQLERYDVVRQRATENQLAIFYVNQVGGQDELVFDGASFVMNAEGKLLLQADQFEAGLYCLNDPPAAVQELPGQEAAVYRALVVGVRDYANKNGFRSVLLGLSGGIDSALTLAVAADALGPERVQAVMMPFRYTSDMSQEDAALEASRLAVEYKVVSIEPMYKTFATALESVLGEPVSGLTAQNLQARCRGVLLMGLSNRTGALVLTTGNKSEMAVGYATLYGDMAGGFDVLKDVPKLLVYRLAEYRNRESEVIPQRVIERPPTAELAPDQRDSDSLPDYEVLDPILEMYVEHDASTRQIVAAGFPEDLVEKVVGLVDRNEYKRRQAPVGVRISRRAFGRDRRYPITNGWKAGN